MQICKNCGHVMCPYCVTWCDVVTEEATCCDGECQPIELTAMELTPEAYAQAFDNIPRNFSPD